MCVCVFRWGVRTIQGVSGEKTCTNVLLAPVQCWFKRFYCHGLFNMEAEVVSLVLYDLELYIRDHLRVRLHKIRILSTISSALIFSLGLKALGLKLKPA